VADYRPAVEHAQKLKKVPGIDTMDIAMTKNPDIIAGVDGASIVKIGFAAETEDLIAHARVKLAAKSLQMIVANDAARTIGSDRVTATLLYADGREPQSFADLPKPFFARELIAEIARLCKGRGE
jgi:phosphopantothenoylcysteine decarboxylase / phosphopantothenate---cysteine ligase